MTKEHYEMRVLILAPTKKDAINTVAILKKKGIKSHVSVSIKALGREIKKGAGALLITEEALLSDYDAIIQTSINTQPAWSDFPVIVLTRREGVNSIRALSLKVAGNITLIKRPLYIHTLIGTIQAALRDRNRQYIVRDYIHEREQHAQDLELINEVAVIASIAKSDFLANMSHEIRTPMNSIIGTTELLYNTSLTHEQQEYVHTIYQAGDVLLTLIDDILDFSRIEAGEMEIHPTPFKIKPLLDDVIQLFVLRAEKNQVRLALEYQEDIPYLLLGDAKRLKQILLNLVGNAIKFTAAGSITVRVSTLLQTEKNITLLFEVEDTGIGIAANKLEAIFEKFIQAENFTNKKFGGTGLGLAISKKLVELMAGTLGVRSILGKGSCFWFQIPFVYSTYRIPSYMAKMTEQESTREETRLAIKDSRKITHITSKFKGHVLVVEDYLPNQKMVKMMLEKMGCSVDVASNGEEALEKIRNNHYNIVFMDCQMPEMDGFEATKLIRDDKTIAHTIVVALTANALEGDRERCLAADMDNYISKPIRYVELEKILAEYL